MGTGIDNAAAAFDKDMGIETQSSIDTSSQPSSMGIEDLFPRRVKEVDDESPAQGGGDDTPPPVKGAQEVERPNKAAQKVVEGEEPTEDEILYGKPKEDEEEETTEDEEDEEVEDPVDDDEDEVDLDESGDKKVRVTIDGEEKVVTLKEATQGYIRTQTFHQRLNHLDQVETVLREEAAALLNDKKAVVQQLDGLIEDTEALIPPEPDWDAEFAKDATSARRKQKAFQEIAGKLSALREKRKAAAEEVRKQAEREIADFGAKERKKFEDANPHWIKDPAKKKVDLASMIRTARAHKLTDKEIAGILDSRYLGILLKASKYDRMMAARPKSVPRGKSPVKPGSGKSRSVPRGADRSRQQLQRSGRVTDAAAVFTDIINQEG